MAHLAFNRWLGDQLGRLDAVGQLSRDTFLDSCWPRAARTPLADLEAHLTGHRAPAGVVAALRSAHTEWQVPS